MPNNLGREKNDMYQGISTNFKLPTHGILYHDYGGVHKSTYIPCNITAGGVAKVNGQEVAGCFFISLSLSCTLRRILSPFIQDFCTARTRETLAF